MISRFIGSENEKTLTQCLMQQTLIHGNQELAEKIKARIEIKEFKKDETIIKQNESSNEVYFLLIGSVSIEVNGRKIAERKANTHFGEMTTINPSAKRSASVVCSEDSVVAILSSHDFNDISSQFPKMFSQISIELSNRLVQRNRLVRPVNVKPALFIASSKESLFIALKFKVELDDGEIDVNVWSDLGIFTPSRFPIQDLEDRVKASDFALVVLNDDDKIFSRWKLLNSTRDNVLIELGLFIGALSHERTFIVLPMRKKIKIPSDILGINMLYINPKIDLESEIKSKSKEIKSIINKYECI